MEKIPIRFDFPLPICCVTLSKMCNFSRPSLLSLLMSTDDDILADIFENSFLVKVVRVVQ